MANSLHAEPRRLYSWWWDSHISPKSSKWLQENLTDMDSKVKAMIKLIEEDADSFAKRAEMYYKKRPELINLVEEFYRAYRALAERYDHATGVLQHAHQTMAEAFPSQNSLASNDKPSSSPSGTVLEPHTDSDNLQNDSFCMSSHFHLIEQTGAYSEENDALTHRKGLQHLNDMFFEGEAHSHFHGVAKGLQSQEEEGNNCHSKAHDFAGHLQIQVPNAKEDVINELEPLKNQLSQLLTENQELKFQIASESERADKAEIEAQHLKNNHSKWNFEKETFIRQYQQSLTRISVLDTKISQAEDELKKFDDDLMMRASNLTIAEERCLLLEDKNQSLQLELDKSEQKTKSQQKLNQKLEELEKISIWIKDEQRRCVDVELALLSLQKLHSQSQEELKYLALEVQRGHDKLEELEPRNMSLEQDVCTLTKENSNLSEKNDSLVLKINDMVDQISNSMEIREKLDNELRLRIEESKVLRYELDSLKDDKKDLEWRHQSLTKDMEAVSLSAESLQVLVKELHGEALELKEICKKHEDANFLLLENLKNTEKVLERNLTLENSLMDSNVELEGFRNEIKTLEGSCKSLHCELDAYITENFMLVSQVEIVARDMEKIMQKNAFLEGCISDMNTELEGLRVSLKDLEEYCQTLHDQRVNLLDEKGILVSQVEKLSQNLESLESRHAELEDRRLSLEKERYSAVHYLKELEGFLKLEKEHHETLILSSKSQEATLENHIHLLREEIRFTKEKFETEEQNFTSAVLEIFILQSCLCDMKEMNLNLSKDCQKQLEAFDSAEKLVSQLKQEDLIQKEKMMVLLKHNEKLVHGMRLLLGALNINEYKALGGVEDESLLQIIFAEFKMLQSKISDAQDEILHFNLEISVRDTLLQQLGLDVKDMRMEKIRIEEEFFIVKKQLLGLQLKNQELREVNEDVKQELHVKGQREEELMFEVKILQWELSDSREAYQTIQAEANKLIDENLLLTEKYYNLKHKKDAFEEEKSTALSEAMLHMLCKSFNAEEALGLKLDTDEMNLLHAVMGIFGRDTKTMNDKIHLLEEENARLMESFDSFVEYRNLLVILEFDLNTAKYTCEELSSQTETGKVLLTQRESELTEANHMVQAMQNRNSELTTRLEGLIQEISGAKAIREGLEKTIFTLSEDVACKMEEILCIRKENELLHGELEKLNSEVELLSNREEHMTYKLLKGKGEIDRCEVDTRKLSDDIRNSIDSEAVFEEKVVELELECENIELYAMLQRDVLTEEITSRNEFIKELKERLNNLEGENRGLKAKMNAYLPYVMSLRESLISLEDRTCLLAGLYSVYAQEKQHDKSNPLNEDSTAMDPSGVLELKKLIVKVESLEQVTTDICSHLKQELFGSCNDLEAKRNDIKKVNVKGNTTKEEDKMKMEIILQPNEEGKEHGMDYERQSYDAKILKMNYENTKDIQLDQASSASSYRNSVGSYGLSRTDNSESDYQGQKIQYILLKAEEPESSESRATDRRLNVLLKDYFCGIRKGVRKNKGKFCGCMRPKKHGD